MSEKLNEQSRALIARPILATLATVAADGGPQASPLWIDAEGDDLLINTAKGRAKARNIARDPRVGITVVDPENPYRVVALRGTVIEVTTEGADDHIDHLAKKYLGVDSYPNRRPDEVRLKIRIRVDKVAMQPT
jgi:PPOX class probable F420-dependent enzyme